MAFDVARIRGLFPALGDGWVHFDGTAGMQVPEQVATAVSTALRAPVSAPGGVFPASQRSDAIVTAARRAVADLVGGDPAGVVLGPSAAVLLDRLAAALSGSWKPGDEVVCSRLDERMNVAPWRMAAERAGASVRWGEIDIETCELPAWQYTNLVNSRTRAVAVTAASGAVGTCTDVPQIARAVRGTGATLVVDASFAAPFLPLDIEAIGADVLALSAQVWGGPTIGALVFRDPRMIEQLPAYALAPEAGAPDRFELGPHPYPSLAGLVASIDYLADLDDAAGGTRRERLVTSLGSVRAYHDDLFGKLLTELRSLRHVMLIGDAEWRIPVLAFTVADTKAAEVADYLARRGLCAFADSASSGVFATLGVGEVGGAVRVGFAHYTNAAEVTQLADALADLR